MLCPRDKCTSKARSKSNTCGLKRGAGGPQTVLSGRAAGHAASLSAFQPPPCAALSFPRMQIKSGRRSCFEFLQEGDSPPSAPRAYQPHAREANGGIYMKRCHAPSHLCFWCNPPLTPPPAILPCINKKRPSLISSGCRRRSASLLTSDLFRLLDRRSAGFNTTSVCACGPPSVRSFPPPAGYHSLTRLLQ